ncbi:MAG: mandelate racemase [Alphaproteobacteria bacterium]|nr:mandelate racemase [Alphaproteobacteria bacterium]
MTAPRLTITEVDLFERDVVTRLPFRFGVVTLTQAPQAFVRARIRTEDGREAAGAAAELMVPKWFDKNPALSNEQNIDQLRASCALAADAYQSAGPASAFGLTAASYHPIREAAADAGLNGLVAGFGAALIDRAVLDALCRASDLSFFEAVRANLPGIEAQSLTPDLAGFDLPEFLASLAPRARIHARHTVGMLDPLVAADQTANDRLDDGLPETLEEVVGTYGHRYYKVKVRGELNADIDRLCGIAAVLDAAAGDYRVTLDGNEQYDDSESLLALWQAIEAEPRLARFGKAILFIEQPIKRAAALDRDVGPISAIRPVILDESDDSYDTFVRGRAKGYRGISSKTCKGIYKSILNAARCAAWNAGPNSDGGRFFMSAEDLTCQAGLSVQQDLALVALLGLDHVERNGHHYVFGMAGAPEAEQAAFRAAHPGLYRDLNGHTCLAITGGEIDIGALGAIGYATGAQPDWQAMRARPRPIPSAKLTGTTN